MSDQEFENYGHLYDEFKNISFDSTGSERSDAIPRLKHLLENIIGGGGSFIGSFVWRMSENAPSHLYAMNGQTILNGASLYPKLSSQIPQWISGNDIVLPDWSGRFIRNVGGNASSVGSLQDDATAANGLSGTVLGAGLVGNNRRTGGSANAVRTGQTRSVLFGSSDIETRPKNVTLVICIIAK